MPEMRNVAKPSSQSPTRQSISRRRILWFGLAGLVGFGVALLRRVFPNMLPPEVAEQPQPSMAATPGPTAASTPFANPPEPTPTSSAMPTHTTRRIRPRPTSTATASPEEAATPAAPEPNDMPLLAGVPRPPIISQAEWGAAPPGSPFIPHYPRQITLHHEGVYFDGSIPAAEYLRKVQHWSITDRGWPDIPYHFIIDLDGLIYAGRPLEMQGDTNTAYDLRGHALVSLLGKYDAGEQEPAWHQIEATIAIMAWIAYTYAISPDLIYGHRDFVPLNEQGEHIDPRTGEQITCPGDNLYRYLADGTITQGVAALLAQAK